MSLFGWLRRNRDKVSTPPDTDERLRALERDSKQLRLEWDDTYESIGRLVRKLARREQRDAGGEESAGSPDISPSAGAAVTVEQLRAVARQRGLMR
jgi:hypothetical protein